MPHQGTDTQTAQPNAQKMPKPLNIDGSILEHRPNAQMPTADEMFLSPRVLDAGAFGRYAEMLKSIITKASNEGRTLEDFCTDAEAMIQRSSDAEQTLNTRLQAGVRMLRMIDERADRTDQLLDKVRENLPDAQALQSQIDEAINARITEAQSRIDESIAQAEQRVAQAEQRAQLAAEKTDAETAKLDAAIQNAQDHLSSIEQRIAEAVLQSEKSLHDLDQHASTSKAVLEQTFEKSLAHANSVGATLADRVEEASRLTDDRIRTLSQSIAPLTDAAEQAMRTLGIDPENPRFEDSPLSRIESLVQRSETQIAAIDRVFAQLDDLRGQAEFARNEFGRWLIDAADDLDTLETRKDALTGPIHRAAAQIADLEPDLEDKLELASTKLGHLQLEQQTLRETINASSTIAQRATDRLENQTGQLQALLDGSLHKLTQRVEQAGVWLGSLITRAEQLGEPLREEASQLSHTLTAPSPIDAAMETVAQIQSTITESSPAPTRPSNPTPSAETPTPPTPPHLPIDAISFDGDPQIIPHNPDA